MTAHIEARFEISNWDEAPFDELAGATGGGKFRADPAGSVTLDLDGV